MTNDETAFSRKLATVLFRALCFTVSQFIVELGFELPASLRKR